MEDDNMIVIKTNNVMVNNSMIFKKIVDIKHTESKKKQPVIMKNQLVVSDSMILLVDEDKSHYLIKDSIYDDVYMRQIVQLLRNHTKEKVRVINI
jgi:hypothetical protein